MTNELSPKRGRKGNGEERRGRVSVALDDDEKALIQHAADEMGQTISGYMRWVSLRAAKEARG